MTVKSLKEFSSLKQYQYVKGFQKFHTGVKLRCALCLSLQFLRFLVIYIMAYNTRFVFKTKKKHNSTSAFDNDTYLQASETHFYLERSCSF